MFVEQNRTPGSVTLKRLSERRPAANRAAIGVEFVGFEIRQSQGFVRCTFHAKPPRVKSKKRGPTRGNPSKLALSVPPFRAYDWLSAGGRAAAVSRCSARDLTARQLRTKSSTSSSWFLGRNCSLV